VRIGGSDGLPGRKRNDVQRRVSERRLRNVTTDDAAARRLYLRLGFVVYGTETHALKLADGAYVDENFMVFAL
jgi:hypothetical protein